MLVVRLARGRARREMLQLRTPQSGPVGVRAAAAQPRQRPRFRAARHLGLRRSVRRLAAALGQRDAHDRRHLRLSRARHRRALSARRIRRKARLRIRLVVDRVERRMASRKPAAHHLQHDVGPRSRTGRRRHVWRGADGDHLHRRRRVGLSAELGRLRLLAALAVPERRRRHSRRIRIGLRISRRAGLLRPPHRKLADTIGSHSLRADSWIFRIRDARRRQLRSRGRIFRRLPGGPTSRSSQARAGRPHRHGTRLHCRDVPRHCDVRYLPCCRS